MENFSRSSTSNDIITLREGIQQRYKSYQLLDRDQFPEFVYNTNRANYEPLRASFEQELYVVKGLGQTGSTIHIPSTNTLALLFTKDSYVPTKKILNTCRLYAVDLDQSDTLSATRPVRLDRPLSSSLISPNYKTKRYYILGSLLMLLVVLSLGYKISSWKTSPKPKAQGLVIVRPTQNEIVTRDVIVEGIVTNAETVYVLTGRQKAGYWVQRPFSVNKDGTWKGQVLIGHYTNLDTGVRFQIRAVVHPVKPMKEQDYFRPWPDAELSSATVEVIKGTNSKKTAE